MYNTRYESYYQLAHPGLNIDNDASRVSCIHYTNYLHGKLGEEMEGRFNQELPDKLWSALVKVMNFKPRILPKQCINTRWVNEINHIDVSSDYQEFEVNESHVRNPNYKGKNYNPNYQRISKIQTITPTIAINPASDTRETTITAEGTLAMLRMTTQRSHQILKLLPRGL